MARSKNIYKPLRNKHGEGKRRYTTIGLNEDVAAELKMVVKAYSEVYGRMTPAQVIKRLIDAGLKRCDPEVFEAFIRRTEIGPEPVLEIVHPTDPTKGEVWNMRYFVEKDGENIELRVGDKQPFYGELNGRNVGLWKFLQEGWIFMNDAGVEINIDQAKVISEKIKKHLAGL